MLLLFVVLQYFLSLSTAQSFHNITVGVTGSFFDPRTLSAGVNDTVNFIFRGDSHSVVQSTFANPCTPLPGGFSSPYLGRGDNFQGPTPIFSITVTNGSTPIYYFCANTLPASHCNDGMIGAINPPSADNFTAFANAAQMVSGTPVFSPVVSTGSIGARVTGLTTLNDAGPMPTTLTPDSSLTSSPTSTSTASASTPSPSSSNRGAIIGGAVGAALGAFVLLCIALILWRRIKIQRRASTSSSSFFHYNHRPTRSDGAQSLFSNNAHSPPNTAGLDSSINYTSTLSPNLITTFDSTIHEVNPPMQKQPSYRTGTSITIPQMSEHNKLMNNTTNTPLQPVRYLPHQTSAGQLSNESSNTQGLVGTMYNNDLGLSSINQQASYGVNTHGQQSNIPRPPESSHSGSERVDIQTLAKEVAAVILKESKSTKATSDSRDDRREGGSGSGPRSEANSYLSNGPPPPRYHTVNNTEEGSTM